MPSDIQKKIYSVLQFVQKNKYSTLYKDILTTQKGEVNLKFKSISPTTITLLRERHQNLLHYPEKDIRYLVSEFDQNNAADLFLVPQRTDYVWDLLKEEVEIRDPIVAILSVPAFWQMGPMFYRTCRQSKVPVSVVSHRNLPLTVQIIKEVKSQLVVTTPEIATELQKLLMEEGIGKQIKTWHLVTPVGQAFKYPKLSGEIKIEFHLFPGVPVGYAPYTLLNERPGYFFPNAEYFFEIEGGRCFITSLEPHALPFVRLQIAKKAEKTVYKSMEMIKIYES